MLPYFIMLGVPGALAFTSDRGRSRIVLFLVASFFWVMIGLRFHVGTDWNNYLFAYVWARRTFLESLISREPGFALLNWFTYSVGGGYILLNAIAALVFCWGFFYLARRCHEPFLAITVATPLVAIATAMNLTRQSIALGIVCWLFATWDRGGVLRRTAIVLFAALFHFSAIFVLTFVALSLEVHVWLRVVAAAAVGIIIFGITAFAPTAIEAYSQLYVSGQMTAPGALSHLTVLGAAAVTYLFLRRRWDAIYGENRLCFSMAVMALVLIPSIAISSVGAYRLSLYLWPMAMYVWAGAPGTLATSGGNMLYRLLVVAGSVLLLLAWLMLANNSPDWQPYHNWLTAPANAPMAMQAGEG